MFGSDICRPSLTSEVRLLALPIVSQTAPRSNPLSHSPHSLFSLLLLLLRRRHHAVANQIFCSFNKRRRGFASVGPGPTRRRRRWIHVTALLTRTNTSFSWRRRGDRRTASFLPFFHPSLHAPCHASGGTVKQLDCITDVDGGGGAETFFSPSEHRPETFWSEPS